MVQKLNTLHNIHPKVFEFSEKALEYIKENLNNNEFLILLDIYMPILDGWQFLDELESINADCKIIVITTSLSQEERHRASSNHRVINFFVKPLQNDDFGQVMDNIMNYSF